MKKAGKSVAFPILIVLSVLLLLTPFAVVSGVVFGGEKVYRNTFYAELDDKYDALYSAEGEKIVLIGGSSVAFGYDSETLSKLFDRPVVNFGLYAELGTKLMLDLAEDAIGEGDIVLLAPELDPQTLSLYFSGGATLKALEEKPAMFRGIRRENYASLWGALWSFAGEKFGYLKKGAPDPAGVYNSRNFNAYGDVDYKVTETDENGEPIEVDGRKEKNVMSGFFDSSTPVTPDPSIVSDDFLDYLNGFVDRITDRGAVVYFVFCPVNAMALTLPDETGEEIPLGADALTLQTMETVARVTGVSLPDRMTERCTAFDAYLAEVLHCKVLGSTVDFVYAPNYFYDTNFHLNSRGTALHTAKVGNLLYGETYETDEKPLTESKYLPKIEIPLADMETVYDVGNLKYRLTLDDAFSVVGVTETGKTKETVVLPTEITVYDAKLGFEITRPVSAISTGAFAGTTRLKTVVIGDENRMKEIGTRAFADSSVSEIYLFCPVEGFLAGKDMLGGAVDGFRIRVGQNLGYETDYSWGEINVEGQPKILDVTEKTFADFAD